jgi:hypothetical protein
MVNGRTLYYAFAQAFFSPPASAPGWRFGYWLRRRVVKKNIQTVR